MFTLDQGQKDKAMEWVGNHDCKRAGEYSGATGGTLTYHFTPTSVGMVVKIECWCEKECDLSDYGKW